MRALLLSALLAAPLLCQTPPPAFPEAAIDQAVRKVLAQTGTPAASVAVARGGAVYVHAWGQARLNPRTPVTPEMRWSTISIALAAPSVSEEVR